LLLLGESASARSIVWAWAGVIVHVSKICDRRFAAMRICCLNNYSLVEMRELTAAGRMPRQHLWGTDQRSLRGIALPRRAVARRARAVWGAAVVVVPVIDPGRLTGLTEINDALALGKPLIVTRSPYLPFDVEEVGCGIAVEPGDETGWRAALERLLGDAGLRGELGARGRAHDETGFNYAGFGAAARAAVTRPLPA
jgi:hypothetical protein